MKIYYCFILFLLIFLLLNVNAVDNNGFTWYYPSVKSISLSLPKINIYQYEIKDYYVDSTKIKIKLQFNVKNCGEAEIFNAGSSNEDVNVRGNIIKDLKPGESKKFVFCHELKEVNIQSSFDKNFFIYEFEVPTNNTLMFPFDNYQNKIELSPKLNFAQYSIVQKYYFEGEPFDFPSDYRFKGHLKIYEDNIEISLENKDEIISSYFAGIFVIWFIILLLGFFGEYFQKWIYDLIMVISAAALTYFLFLQFVVGLVPPVFPLFTFGGCFYIFVIIIFSWYSNRKILKRKKRKQKRKKTKKSIK